MRRQDEQRSLVMTCGGLVSAVGLVAFVRGVWLASHAAGWMCGGLAVCLPALFVAYDAFREK